MSDVAPKHIEGRERKRTKRTPPPPLAHHFDDLEQQHQSATMGIWIFLVTEIMLFGGLFLCYTVYRRLYPEAFAAGSHHLDLTLGAINTVILIASSYTMALAVRSAQLGQRRPLVFFLLLTFALGSVFLGIKAVEYRDKFHHHLVPGPNFKYPKEPRAEWNPPNGGARAEPGTSETPNSEVRPRGLKPAAPSDPQSRSIQLFFCFYFALTGLHAAHMVIGAVIMLIIARLAWLHRFSSQYHSPVETLGLYWHFVDIVWIFLFPLLYLVGHH